MQPAVVPHTQTVHGVHVGEAPAANLPAVHAVQAASKDAPAPELYDPAAHARQAVDPTRVTYLPAAQGAQVAAPRALYVPASQLRQDKMVPPVWAL